MKIPDYNKKIKHPTYLELQEEIERLHSIIKEVREYINSIGWNTTIPNIQDNVWKILDKVGSDKE